MFKEHQMLIHSGYHTGIKKIKEKFIRKNSVARMSNEYLLQNNICINMNGITDALHTLAVFCLQE